jgi:DNA-directed RNA polymerase specialized sigma24 family protein
MGKRNEEEIIPTPFLHVVNLARQGDHEAWAVLISNYEPELRQMAVALLGPELRREVDPADVVQLVHWTLCDGLRKGKYQVAEPEHLLALSLTILRRTVSRIWRRLKHQRQLILRAKRTLPSGTDPSQIAVETHDHTTRVSAQDHFEYLCNSLSDMERRLFELKWHGYNTAEAARLLRRDPDTLRVTLKRLRRKLIDRIPQSDRPASMREFEPTSRPSAS